MYESKESSTDKVKNTSLKNSFSFFQPKLIIGNQNDVLEEEADGVANGVMQMTDSKIAAAGSFFKPSINSFKGLQRTSSNEEVKIRKAPHDHIHREIKENSNDAEISTSNTDVADEVSSYVNTLSLKGSPLPPTIRNFFEPRFGHDFSGVKIHNDANAAKSAESLNAQAYTTNNHIVFNTNKFSPDSDSGKNLLAHELTHTIQQKSNNLIFKRDKGKAQKAVGVREKSFVVKYDVNQMPDETIDLIEKDKGSRIKDGPLVRLRGKLNAVVSSLVDEEPRLDIGQLVTLTIKIDSESCEWKDFENCEYSIYATHEDPKEKTPLEQILDNTGYCIECLVIIKQTDKAFEIKYLKTSEGRYSAPSEPELQSIKDALQQAQDNPGESVVLPIQRLPATAPGATDVTSESTCDMADSAYGECIKRQRTEGYQEGIRVAGEFAEAYYNPLSGGAGEIPMIGALKLLKPGAKLARAGEKIGELGKAGSAAVRAESRIRIPKITSLKGSVSTFDKELVRRAAEIRETQAGVTLEAFKSSNVAVARVKTASGEIVYIEAGNMIGAAHSEEYILSQLKDSALGLGKDARVEQIYSERIPCANCGDVIKRYFGEDTAVFYTVGNQKNRGELLMKAYGL
jgi:hypothetical protein